MNDHPVITSRDNEKLKFARRVRDGKEPAKIFIEGVHLAAEAIRSGVAISHVFAAESFVEREHISEIGELLSNKRFEVTKVASRIFESIADTENPQGIILIGERRENRLENIIVDQDAARPIVFLHSVNNPSNLGAVVRTAEAAGAVALITSSGSADAFSPKAIRASMGSCFRLPIVEGVSFERAIEWAKQNSLTTTAADVNSKESYTEIDWKVPRLLILGSEAHGLGERELATVDLTIRIPMTNDVESLNLAVSAGIILFEARRQCQ